MKKYILGLISGIIICSGVVYAANLLASDIEYDNSKSHLKDSNNKDITNVQDAVDALYTKVNSGSGKTICTYVDSTFGNSSDHYSIGTKYSCEVKDNTSYNFYVLTNHTDSVDLIMEYNITELVGSIRTMNWQTAMNYFRNGDGASLNWEVPVDLPAAQAIADAVGNTTWNTAENDTNGWFCLGSKVQDYSGAPYCNQATNRSKAWLFNYTRGCSSYGCDSVTSLGEGQAYGYWTKDMVINSTNPALAWSVTRDGTLYSRDVTNMTHRGVRPVISILKSNMN